MKYLLILLFPVLSGCALLVAGAVGAAVVVGAYAWSEGELERSYDVGFDAGWDAILKAVDKLQLKMISKDKDVEIGTVQAKKKEGTQLTIKLKYINRDRSSISVRVGTFGDRPVSERIHDTILDELQKK